MPVVKPVFGLLGPAPYYSFTLHGWVPCLVTWDPETGRFTRVEGPDAFTTSDEAEEASRFLRVVQHHGERLPA
jgi:hypothetical protein